MGLQFTLADGPVHVRVGPSPLHELTAVLRLCITGQPHAALGALPHTLRSALADSDVALCAAFAGIEDYMPDFVTPVPEPGDTVADLLDQVDATPPVSVTTQLRMASNDLSEKMFRLVTRTDPERLATRIARGLWRFDNAIDASLRTALETTNRAFEDHYSRATDATATAALSDLHQKLNLAGSTLLVGAPPDQYETGRIRSIMLSASSNANIWVQPQGGCLWLGIPDDGSAPRPAPPAPHGSRRRVLDAITHPMSTQQLSRLLDLSPATISYHLSIAVRAGLLSKQRRGREVLYGPTSN